MIIITDEIKRVVEAMRPVSGQRYGAAMMTYLGLYNTPTAENLALMPYYMPGHPLEVTNRLLEKDADEVYKYRKYPLIALRLDIPEPYSEGGMYEYDLNIAIITLTEKNWNYEERLENVFKPCLEPLYEQFIKMIVQEGHFEWEGDQRRPPHTPILRPYWGVENGTRMGNDRSIINDPLDAIEIKNLRIKKKIKC
jgi:hypothetical protein